MLAHQEPNVSLGRTHACTSQRFCPPEQLQLPHQPSDAIQKNTGSLGLRILPPVAPINRLSSTPGVTSATNARRPKEEPKSPQMSDYGYSASGQGNYSYPTTYQTTIPQYTQAQINQYYAQYQCYPPQPYQVIADYYTQPTTVPHTSYQQPMTASAYETPHWQGHMDNLEPPTSQGPTRSNSRTRTWTCDIASCTSSANFTRLADLQRHQSTVHGVGAPEYPCTVPRCNRVGDKGFTRRDHLVEHLRNFHHIDIPKRRPGERSAFPFGYPEGFQSQDLSSNTECGQGRRASRSGERGRVVKPSRRGGRAGGRGRGGSRAAGIVRTSGKSQEPPNLIQQARQDEERGREMIRGHRAEAAAVNLLGTSGMELAHGVLSLEHLPLSSQQPLHGDELDPWDLA